MGLQYGAVRPTYGSPSSPSASLDVRCFMAVVGASQAIRARTMQCTAKAAYSATGVVQDSSGDSKCPARGLNLGLEAGYKGARIGQVLVFWKSESKLEARVLEALRGTGA